MDLFSFDVRSNDFSNTTRGILSSFFLDQPEVFVYGNSILLKSGALGLHQYPFGQITLYQTLEVPKFKILLETEPSAQSFLNKTLRTNFYGMSRRCHIFYIQHVGDALTIVSEWLSFKLLARNCKVQ